MMRMNTSTDSQINGGVDKEWELRPGGMLVQKRKDAEIRRPTIRVRVKYGSVYHEIHVSSQATFGELKKILCGRTGLHHQDQKLFFKKKEKDSCSFLDMAGVKDKSKITLVEDPISQEKRYIEMSKNAKSERAAKSISEISLEVDRLASEVSALETVVSKGGKLGEKDVMNLIELLMNELLKLDAIAGDGDVKLQRKMQVRRVQKYVETLDILKMNKWSHSPQQARYNDSAVENLLKLQQPLTRHSSSVVITTQWETFDSAPPTMKNESAAAASQLGFPWELV